MVPVPLLLLLLGVIGKITYQDDFFLEDNLTLFESGKEHIPFATQDWQVMAC